MAQLLTIFISSTISYADSLECFCTYFNKFWGDCDFDVVLCTNYPRTPFSKRCRIINSGDPTDDWISRSLPALMLLDSKFVLVMCDDLFLRAKVNNRSIIDIAKFMDANGVDYCRMKACHSGKVVGRDIAYLKTSTPYGFNLQCGIFKKSFLINELRNTASPWDLEKKWLKEAANSKDVFFSNAIVCRHNIIKYYHGILKGEWYPSVLKRIRKECGNVGLSRSVMSRRKEIRNKLFSAIGGLAPSKARGKLKSILRKFGFKFTTTD